MCVEIILSCEKKETTECQERWTQSSDQPVSVYFATLTIWLYILLIMALTDMKYWSECKILILFQFCFALITIPL